MGLGQQDPDNDSNHSEQIYPSSASTLSWKDEDPLHLLNDYNPTGCTKDEGNACIGCLRLVEIDAEIRDAYDRLQSLAEKRRMAKEDANRVMHDPIVPRLPIELVCRIFEEWVESFGEPFLPVEVDAEPSIAHVPLPAPLILSAVCRKWRQISHNTPRLWATVNIVSLREISPLRQELIKQWLNRSGQQPLKIWLHVESEDSSEDAYWDVTFFEDLRACAARWQSFTLCIRSSFWPPFFKDIAQVPMLKCLVLWPTYDDCNLSATISSLRLKAPWLENLQIRFETSFEAIIAQQENNLTTFLMQKISLGNFFELLRRAPNLQKCSVSVSRWHGSPGPALPEAPLLHSTLSDLTINPVEAQDMIPLLDCLSLPSLRNVHFRIGNREVLLRLIPFVSRSKCAIRLLWLRASTDCFDDEVLIQVLRSIPTVQTLACSIFSSVPGNIRPAIWSTDAFFNALRPTVENGKFLPDLHTLNISFYKSARFSFSWASFLDTLDLLHSSYLQDLDTYDSDSSTNIADGSDQQRGFRGCPVIHIMLDTMSYPSPYQKQSDWIDEASLHRFQNAEWHSVFTVEFHTRGRLYKKLL